MMLTCNCQHRVADTQLSPAWNTGSHAPQGISLAGIKFVRFRAVFEKFFCKILYSHPPGGLTPLPMGNPGSPTVYAGH